jgi:hypothetical protein
MAGEHSGNYVGGSKPGAKAHNTSAEEIRLAFIQVGWVGQRGKAEPLKIVPFFDKGPGAQCGR